MTLSIAFSQRHFGIVHLAAFISISRRSYRTRGVTAPPQQAQERKALGMSYQQYRFQAFGRDGLDCYAYGATIERHTMGSRNLFVCPRCQQGLKKMAGNSTT
jgi:formamidopyrimidine-DNA glycosylase